jgi:hypothetical protein
MDVFGARPSEASAVCFDEIAETDSFVGFYAHRLLKFSGGWGLV